MATGIIREYKGLRIVPCSDVDGWYAEILFFATHLKTISDSFENVEDAVVAAQQWIDAHPESAA